MLEKLTKCPLCKSGLFLNDREIIDHAVSKEIFNISKCSNCGLLFTNPRPNQTNIGPYYDFPEYFSHDDQAKSPTQLIYQTVRKRAITSKLNLFHSLQREKGSILDYGCGTGELLAKAKDQGWKVDGLEPNEKARNQAEKKLHKPIFADIVDIPATQSFDIISLFHVLEHVHDLRNTLKTIINHLNSDGYVIIAVPNPESYDAEKYKDFWAGWDVPRHLYHFNKTSINSFSNEFKLRLVNTLPMKYDSYYVSLLSEGYKNPAQSTYSKYLKAIKAGMKSNSEARKNNNNYSSNLFIFKKK